MCWATTMTCTPPIIVASKIWQKPWPSLYKLLPSMKDMLNNTIKEEDVELWGGWKVHIVGSYNPWKTQGGKQPRHVSSYTLPVTMALRVEAWVLFTTEQLVSNNKKLYYTNLVIQLQVKSLLHTRSSVWLMYCKHNCYVIINHALEHVVSTDTFAATRQGRIKQYYGEDCEGCWLPSAHSSVGRAMVATGSGFDTQWFRPFAYNSKWILNQTMCMLFDKRKKLTENMGSSWEPKSARTFWIPVRLSD